MSLLGATILTAIATLVLAVFAFITAVLAFLAWRKQSREVSDQASMLKVQSDRLDEQRKINQKQTEVLYSRRGNSTNLLPSGNVKPNAGTVTRPLTCS